MKRILTLLFLLVGWTLSGSIDSSAQGTQKVTIENGEVFVNGIQQANSHLPKSLQNIVPSANFSYFTTNGTYLKIDGHFFKIENNRLIEVDASKIDLEKVTLIFSTDEKGFPLQYLESSRSPQVLASSQVLGPYAIRSGGQNLALAKYTASMNEKVVEIDNIRFKIDNLHAPETAELALELKVGAENMARLAEGFPKVQLQAYLADIEDVNNILYDRLVMEQQMEIETHHLAMRIQSAKTRDEQEKYTAELRESLNQILQLKQENRQKEIEQLTSKLNDLQKRMKERESLKKEIVENRIKELLSQYRW